MDSAKNQRIINGLNDRFKSAASVCITGMATF